MSDYVTNYLMENSAGTTRDIGTLIAPTTAKVSGSLTMNVQKQTVYGATLTPPQGWNQVTVTVTMTNINGQTSSTSEFYYGLNYTASSPSPYEKVVQWDNKYGASGSYLGPYVTTAWINSANGYLMEFFGYTFGSDDFYLNYQVYLNQQALH